MNEQQPLTCPFCGGPAKVAMTTEGTSPLANSEIGSRYFVMCLTRSCADGPIRDTEAEAVAVWQSVKKVEVTQ